MGVNVWLDASLTSDDGLVETLAHRLAADSIAVLPAPCQPDGTSGIVVFDAVTPEALARLQAVSEAGERVLALATVRSALNRNDAWRLLEYGAADVIAWRAEDVATVSERLHRWAALADLVDSEPVREELVGSSPAWRVVLHRLVETARFSSANLLVTGESGTGKELAARLVHHLDPRVVRGRLVVVDCTTIVPALSGSEFFGHERGAFTGAHAARSGAFAAAHGGTLFLDEVGELPATLQAELLRVIQEGTYKRVGGNDWQHASFRLVCATNRNLLREVEEGRFRADLYYRIAVATISLPPLRERTSDILPLFRHFVRLLHGSDLELDPEVADLLQHRDYPGNVRDLRQLVLRLLARHVGSGPITVGDVPEEERPHARPPPQAWQDDALDQLVSTALDSGLRYDEIRAAVTSSTRRVALQRAGGSQKRAAEILGLTPRALQKQRHRLDAATSAEVP